jgi:hypothetical protein
MTNPYRNLLAVLKASGATRLLSNMAWTTKTPAPCGCLFGTVLHHQDLEYDRCGFFRNSWDMVGSSQVQFTRWAYSIGLTQETVEELERFNDGLFQEEIIEAADESGLDEIDEVEIDFDRYASERYRLVVAHLEEKAAKFDREHGVTP